MDVPLALAIGFAAGVMAGMLGVGGGVLFVPALSLALGLSQLDAEATSLLAIVPVALVGAWRQRRYGNVRLGEGAGMGALAVGGAALGVAVANALPQDALRVGFAGLMLLTAAQLVRQGLRRDSERRAAETA